MNIAFGLYYIWQERGGALKEGEGRMPKSPLGSPLLLSSIQALSILSQSALGIINMDGRGRKERERGFLLWRRGVTAGLN